MGKVVSIITGGLLIVGGLAIGVFTGQWGLAGAMMVQGGSMIYSAAQGDRDLSGRQGAVLQGRADSKAGLPVVYGKTKLGPIFADIRVDEGSESNKRLVMVCAWCHGSQNGSGIQAIDEIYIDNRLAWTPGSGIQAPFNKAVEGDSYQDKHLKVTNHLGTDTQTVDSDLTALFPTEWPSSSAGKGVAYSVLMLWFNPDIYGGGLPRVQAVIRGNKLFDPRTSGTVYSTNPALAIYDFLTSDVYGYGATNINTDSFESAADYSDELVTPYSGASQQKRFECGGWADTTQPIQASLADLSTSCRATVLCVGGTWRIAIRQEQSPTGLVITPDNTVEGSWKYLLPGSSGTPNSIVVNYLDPDRGWQVDTVHWPEPDASNPYLTEDNDYVHQITIDLPFTDNRLRAQQIGMTILKESRSAIAITLTGKEDLLPLEYGDLVAVTQPSPNWDEKLFWVGATNYRPFGEAVVDLALIEYDETAYVVDEEQIEQPDIDPIEPPEPFTCQAPSSIDLVAGDTESVLTAEGIRVPRIRIGWVSADDPYVAYYEVQAKRSEESQWDSYGPAPADDVIFFVAPVSNAEYWDVRIRAVNTIGVHSDWVEDTVMPDVTTAAVVFPSLGIMSTYPYLSFRETDQSLPTGLWRLALNDLVLRIQLNTAAGGDFSTYDEFFRFYYDGSFASANGHFFVDATGAVVTGDWEGSVIGVAYGGTGKSSWTPGGVVFASAAGVLADTSTADGPSIIFTDDGTDWFAVSGSDSGTFYLRMVNGVAEWTSSIYGALNDLTDVTITSPTSGQYLRCDSAGNWQNEDLDVLDSVFGPGDTFLVNRSDVVTWDTIGESDLPTISWSKVSKTGSSLADLATRAISDTTGTLAVSRGGTGKTSWNSGGVVFASASTTLTDSGTAEAASILFTDDGTDWYSVAAPVSGTYYLRTVAGIAEWTSSIFGALTDLTDVTITSPTTGQYLRKSAGDWVNAQLDVEDSAEGPDDTILCTRASSVTWDTLEEDDIPSLTATWPGSVVWAKVSKTGSNLADLATRAISDTTGTLAVNRGGTAKTSWNAGGLVYASSATAFQDTGAGLEGAVAYMPDATSWDTVQPPASGTYVLTADNRVVDWSSAGTIGGSVSTTYIPYASSANTLANSPLYRTSSSLVEGDCDMYLHSVIDHYFRMYVYGDNVNYIGGYGSGGTKSSPTATATQWVLQLGGYGYDGASWTQGAYIGFYAPTTWDDAPAEHGMYIQFATRSGSGALTARWRISESGAFYPLSSLQIGASSAYLSAIYTTNVYGQHHMEVATAGDGGAVSINYSGYQGGTTYYRDFKVYDGKHQVLFQVDGSYHAVSVPGGLLLVDGIDSTVPTGNIGFAESGGNFTMSGRGSHYFIADNDENQQTSVHGFYWRTAYDPPATKMSLLYNTTVGDFVLALPEYFMGYGLIKLVGTQPAGNSNVSYLAFYANDGSTRTGYIGEASAGDRNIHIYADVGDIELNAPSGSVKVSSITATSAYGFTVQPSVGGAVFRAYGYQAQSRLDLNCAEGTPGSETAISVTTIGGIRFYGYDGAAYEQGAGIIAYAPTTWSDSPAEHSTRLIFYTRDTTGALTARWQIQPNGYLWPSGNGAYDIGAPSYQVRILYVNEIQADDGAANDPSYYFDSSSTTGLYYNSGVAFAVAGAAVAAVQASKLIPLTNGYDLGDSTYRWDLHTQNAIVYGQAYPLDMYYPAGHQNQTGTLNINWNNRQVQAASMGAGSLTINVDYSNMKEAGTYHLVVFGPAAGSQNLIISGVDTWVGTSYGSSKSISANEVVTVNLIKLRNRADSADWVVGVTVVDQETMPF